ncbi:MAG TPA: RNA-guided pseudouridylation complex pseudouridine synthase subunit Cbf5 [Nitrososphaeraceae archaeon]|nr:RNA-guided pseudouridylation complex pseudouridine synthase subunit Cbf5 [Nitrososphaeraceae archaeon]
MIASPFNNLVKLDDDVTNEKYGYYPTSRPIRSLLDYGLILLDKPPGPTSHEVVAWVKRIIGISRAGHSGTLDPGATGLLPIGLGEGTKVLPILLFGPKEYYALARLHGHINDDQLDAVVSQFIGDIYQRPPQRSSVKRATRIRTVYEIERLERYERLVLLRILSQSGTYVRKIIYDIGEILGSGATLVELRRTRVSNLSEKNDSLVRMHDLADAVELYKHEEDDTKLRKLIKPIEYCMGGTEAVVVRDSAIDALCHGAQLAIPGILSVSKALKVGSFVGIYSMKGEIVGFGEVAMTREEIESNVKGIAVNIKRIIMKSGSYPKSWHTSNMVSKDV